MTLDLDSHYRAAKQTLDELFEAEFLQKKEARSLIVGNRVRYFRGRVTNFNRSEARKHLLLASDWSIFETLPRKYRTL